MDNDIDYHKYVDNELSKKGFRIVPANEEFINHRLRDLMTFVNDIMKEYSLLYDWEPKEEDYFLNPMTDKWKYSFVILNNNNEICFLSFSSVYGTKMHLHCCFTRKDTRGLGFSKLCMIKMCETALENNFTDIDAYWPKNNNLSIILFLKMGWEIESMRYGKQVYMMAELADIRNKAYNLIESGK